MRDLPSQPDNQFYTKYFLERVDKTTNYLIYAPFPKPDVRDNHLKTRMLIPDGSCPDKCLPAVG